MSDDWFEDEEFWREFKPILFHGGRVEKTQEQVDRFEEFLGLRRGDKVLDQCCGIGRHSLELARRGYEVTGVDLCRGYLEKAREEAEKEGLNVEFVREDMREFERKENYDAAFNFFTSFGYFRDDEENFKVLERIYSSLKPGGKFLVDVMGKEVMARIYTERDWARIEDGFFLEERGIEGDWDLMKSDWILIKDGEVKEHPYYTKLYSAKEMKDLLEQVGFVDIDIYGDLDGGEYDNEAERLVAVARK